MRTSIRLSVLSALIAFSGVALAQSEDRAPAGPSGPVNPVTPVPTSSVQFVLGDLLEGPYDAQSGITASPSPGTIWNRLLGVTRAWGYLWVSGGAGTTGAFMIHQYSLTGTYIQSFVQDVTNSAATIWGARDLAVDEPNFKMWGGMENSDTGGAVRPSLRRTDVDCGTAPDGL
jgi:hypothetical protein